MGIQEIFDKSEFESESEVLEVTDVFEGFRDREAVIKDILENVSVPPQTDR